MWRFGSLREGHGFGVYEDGMLRRIFGTNREGPTRSCRNAVQ
jgi:hypothetical protein